MSPSGCNVTSICPKEELMSEQRSIGHGRSRLPSPVRLRPRPEGREVFRSTTGRDKTCIERQQALRNFYTHRRSHLPRLPPLLYHIAAVVFAMSLASSSFAGQAMAFRPAVQKQQRATVVNVVAKTSRIGKQPIQVPASVKVTLDGNLVKVKVRQRSGCCIGSATTSDGQLMAIWIDCPHPLRPCPHPPHLISLPHRRAPRASCSGRCPPWSPWSRARAT